MREYQKQVAAGIKYLDKHAPKGWRDRIDWKKLDCRSSPTDILSQATGRVGYGGLHYDASLGFCTRRGEDYDELHAEWKRQVPQVTEPPLTPVELKQLRSLLSCLTK